MFSRALRLRSNLLGKCSKGYGVDYTAAGSASYLCQGSAATFTVKSSAPSLSPDAGMQGQQCTCVRI